jgi:hypothetical protein
MTDMRSNGSWGPAPKGKKIHHDGLRYQHQDTICESEHSCLQENTIPENLEDKTLWLDIAT